MKRRHRFPDFPTYLKLSHKRQTTIARELRLSQATISRLARAATVPHPALAERIAKYCDIPVDSFTRLYLARKEESCRNDR